MLPSISIISNAKYHGDMMNAHPFLSLMCNVDIRITNILVTLTSVVSTTPTNHTKQGLYNQEVYTLCPQKKFKVCFLAISIKYHRY